MKAIKITNLTDDQVLELFNPRLLVKIFHPDSKMKPGDILEFEPKKYYDGSTKLCDKTYGHWYDTIKSYEEVFDELEWWEMRDELPQYIKYQDGDVAKVIDYDLEYRPAYANIEHSKYDAEALTHMLPASEREYVEATSLIS